MKIKLENLWRYLKLIHSLKKEAKIMKEYTGNQKQYFNGSTQNSMWVF